MKTILKKMLKNLMIVIISALFVITGSTVAVANNNSGVITQADEATTIYVSTEQEFRDTVDDINNTGDNYILSLTDDIELNAPQTPQSRDTVHFKGCNVTILGNGHSITTGFKTAQPINLTDDATLNLGSPDGEDRLTIMGNDTTHWRELISITYGTVNMYDGVTLRDNSIIRPSSPRIVVGSAVSVATDGATFNMFGGEITNCSVSGSYGYAAGVAVWSGATFNMYGGRISDNTQTNGNYGGAVTVSSSTFNMFGGEISGNLGTFGGGVYICATSVDIPSYFNMTGGKIYENKAPYGGGVFVDSIG
ncbi:MAG: hypothetical protein K2I73_06650, partial [Eubacterium sp.]|nr:hypothetical protein [Eubacterium sp.]